MRCFVTFCYTFLESFKSSVFGEVVKVVKNGKNTKSVAKKCNIVTFLKKSVTPSNAVISTVSEVVLRFYTFFSKLLRERENKKRIYRKVFARKSVTV